MLGIEIRESIIEDADEIGYLNALVWKEAYHGIVSEVILEQIDWKKKAQGQRKFYLEPNTKAFVASFEGKIVGYCNCGPMRRLSDTPSIMNSTFQEDEKPWGEIYALYVRKAYWRLGIGKSLFSKAAEWLKNARYNKFQVYLLANNVSARNFYKTLGGSEEIEREWHSKEETYKEVGMVFFI